MNKRYFFVDFENVGSAGLKEADKLHNTDTVFVFYTKNCNSLKLSYLNTLLKSEAKIKAYRVDHGKEALDNQLSSYLGYMIGRSSEGTEFHIVSKDRGFYVLKNFWERKRDMKIHLIKELTENNATKAAGNGDETISSGIAPAESITLKEAMDLREGLNVRIPEVGNKIIKSENKGKDCSSENPSELIKNNHSNCCESEPRLDMKNEGMSCASSKDDKSMEIHNELLALIMYSGQNGQTAETATQIITTYMDKCSPTDCRPVYRALISIYGRQMGSQIYQSVKDYLLVKASKNI